MLIGICGLAGSGKDTVGNYIARTYDFKTASFAKTLKDVVSVMFNMDRNMLEGDTEASRTWRETEDKYWTRELGYPVTPRKILQLMGTDVGRKIFGEKIWISALFARINPNHNYVLTDVRFRNEIDEIIRRGGRIILVRRGQNPKWLNVAMVAKRSGFTGTNLKDFGEVGKTHDIHRSEWDWCDAPFHYTLANDSNRPTLELGIDNMMTSFNFGALNENHTKYAADPSELQHR